MYNLTSKLKSVKLEFGEDLLVHLPFISLHVCFEQFKVSYNVKEDGPSINLYLIVCKRETDCREITLKVLIWLQPLKIRKRENNKVSLYRVASGADNDVMMKDSSLWVMEKKTFIISSFRHNLIRISMLDKFRFSCSFENNKVSLYQKSNVFCFGSLSDNLHMLNIFSSNKEMSQTNSCGRRDSSSSSSNFYEFELSCFSEDSPTFRAFKRFSIFLVRNDSSPSSSLDSSMITSSHSSSVASISDMHVDLGFLHLACSFMGNSK
ncbi:hypothetical protein Lal_00022875 [Lupinus albus]|nr:hypothetical protein Lal_00022875 [Lupinus albus]